MALPAGLKALGSFKGAKGDTGTLAFITVDSIPAGETPTATMVGPEENRGAHLRLPMGLPGSNAIENAEAVAAYILSPSATQAAVDTHIGTSARIVSLDAYGVVGDGVTDDSAAFQAAASDAAAWGAKLVGGGDIRLAGPVTISSSIELTGRVLIESGSAGKLSFVRKAPVQLIDKGTVTGLVRGSTKITGLPGPGTLAIVSSETLIDRYPSGQGTYTKNETVRVLSDGTISPPLEHTYDVSKITALRYWPEEPDVTITGVQVLIDGTTAGTDYVFMSLTGATVNDCGVVNTATADQSVGLRVAEAGSITFNRLVVAGFLTPGGGYGVLFDRTFDTDFNDCRLGLCRHAVAGRHTNGIRVTGGTIYGGFDTHWGGRIILDGVTSYIPDTHVALDHVLISGYGDVTVTGGEFIGGRAIVGLRADTPTHEGKVLVEHLAFRPAATLLNTGYLDRAVFFAGSVIDAWAAHAFGNTMPSPTVVIRNVTIFAAATSLVRGAQVPPSRYSRGGYTFEVEGLTIRGGASVEVILHGDNTVSPAVTVPTRVRKVAWDGAAVAGATVGVTFRGSSGVASSFSPDIRIDDVHSKVALTFEKDVRCDWTIRNSVVSIINTVNATVEATGNRAEVIGCTMREVWFGSKWTADFIDTSWSGTIGSGSSPTAINARCRSFSGRRAIGTTGAPTHPDGYKNPAFYLTT